MVDATACEGDLEFVLAGEVLAPAGADVSNSAKTLTHQADLSTIRSAVGDVTLVCRIKAKTSGVLDEHNLVINIKMCDVESAFKAFEVTRSRNEYVTIRCGVDEAACKGAGEVYRDDNRLGGSNPMVLGFSQTTLVPKDGTYEFSCTLENAAGKYNIRKSKTLEITIFEAVMTILNLEMTCTVNAGQGSLVISDLLDVPVYKWAGDTQAGLKASIPAAVADEARFKCTFTDQETGVVAVSEEFEFDRSCSTAPHLILAPAGEEARGYLIGQTLTVSCKSKCEHVESRTGLAGLMYEEEEILLSSPQNEVDGEYYISRYEYSSRGLLWSSAYGKYTLNERQPKPISVFCRNYIPKTGFLLKPFVSGQTEKPLEFRQCEQGAWYEDCGSKCGIVACDNGDYDVDCVSTTSCQGQCRCPETRQFWDVKDEACKEACKVNVVTTWWFWVVIVVGLGLVIVAAIVVFKYMKRT